MMRSPNKDYFMDIGESTSSKDGLWDYSGNESNTDSPAFPVNERNLHGMEMNQDQALNPAEESVTLNDAAETLSKSPCKKQTARKSLGRGNSSTPNDMEEPNVEIKLEPNLDDDAANISAKVLHFFCQKCKNGIRYSPNDLQKHFLICHNGELPLYPCEMCNFSANDFQEFNQHRKTHRSTLVKCEICNNDYLYTLLGLTKHFTVSHCVNGHFSCSKCRFSTRDVGTFVQHIHRHNGIEYACQKCNHISYSKPEFQRHLQGHSTMFPFSCQYCNYSAMRKDFIVKHILAKHREHVHRDEHIQDNSNPQSAQANAGLKPVLKKQPTEVQEKTWWRQDGNPSGKEKASEGFERSSGLQFRTPDKEQALKDYLLSVNSEQPSNGGMSSVTTINCNKEDINTQGSLGLLQNAVHGPTVLMVKNNKITVPANYTATFVGYKMVNGKQNLVIKLLPSNKQPTSTSQPSPQSSNSFPRFTQNTNHGSYGTTNHLIDHRSTPSFKPPSVQSAATGSPVEKPSTPSQGKTTSLSSLITRKNESVSRLGTINRSPSFESAPKTMHNFNAPPSASDTGRKIKEEPQDYNINEQQFFDTDHNNESARDKTHTSTASSRLTVDPTTGFLYRPRHNSESSGLPSTGNIYNKDLNSSLLHSSTASGLGNYTYSSFPPKYDFGMRGIQPNDRFPRPMEFNKNNNAPFMPRITSVFSLQSRLPDPKPFGKNTYLHNILQDNRRVNDKVCVTKTSTPLVTSGTLAFAKQSMSSSVPRFENRIPNGNIPSAVFMKQDPDSVGSGGKTFPTRMNDLLKAHSDSIVSQQLVRDRIGTVAKSTGLTSFQQLRGPQIGAMPHNNTVYQSGTNRFPMSGVTNNHPGLRMASSQPSNLNTATFSTRLNAPVMLNTKPGMVLTIANGPFGTIRNVSNGGSQVLSTANTLGKMALPRLQRPPVPHIIRTDFGASPHLSSGVISDSMGNKLPINLNLLQCSMNSDNSRAKPGSTETNKLSQPMQKQSLYALLPDGKQAVLLNYVLPNNAPNLTMQKTIPLNQVSRKLLPKRPDELQQTTLLKSINQANTVSTASVKEEDTSAFEGYGGNVPKSTVASAVCLKSKPEELKPPVRSTSRAASVEENLPTENSNITVSHATASTSKLPKQKSKQSNWSTSSKIKSCKRKTSDSSSYEADYEFKTKRRVTDILQEVPRKQMLHRKCKAKSYSSEVESLPEIPSRSPTPSPVPTPSPSPPPTPSIDVVRALTLFPFSANQPIKYPQRDQPVVVLNHPDADVPEIMNVMKTISKFSGHILKVTLSKKTLEALLESGLVLSNGRRRRRSKPVSPVKERFVLKLTLKKTSKNNYKIVKNTPTDKMQSRFSCWFCGRIFDNQDEWVGHGQRHLMEATKDWNSLC